MSVYIKGMEMPEDCLKCKLSAFIDGNYKCFPLGGSSDFGGTHRPELCPLIHVPPHGRLIDADAMAAYWQPDHNRQFGADYFIHTIETAPTIIPAEKGEE